MIFRQLFDGTSRHLYISPRQPSRGEALIIDPVLDGSTLPAARARARPQKLVRLSTRICTPITSPAWCAARPHPLPSP